MPLFFFFFYCFVVSNILLMLIICACDADAWYDATPFSFRLFTPFFRRSLSCRLVVYDICYLRFDIWARLRESRYLLCRDDRLLIWWLCRLFTEFVYAPSFYIDICLLAIILFFCLLLLCCYYLFCFFQLLPRYYYILYYFCFSFITYASSLTLLSSFRYYCHFLHVILFHFPSFKSIRCWYFFAIIIFSRHMLRLCCYRLRRIFAIITSLRSFFSASLSATMLMPVDCYFSVDILTVAICCCHHLPAISLLSLLIIYYWCHHISYISFHFFISSMYTYTWYTCCLSCWCHITPLPVLLCHIIISYRYFHILRYALRHFIHAIATMLLLLLSFSIFRYCCCRFRSSFYFATSFSHFTYWYAACLRCLSFFSAVVIFSLFTPRCLRHMTATTSHTTYACFYIIAMLVFTFFAFPSLFYSVIIIVATTYAHTLSHFLPLFFSSCFCYRVAAPYAIRLFVFIVFFFHTFFLHMSAMLMLLIYYTLAHSYYYIHAIITLSLFFSSYFRHYFHTIVRYILPSSPFMSPLRSSLMVTHSLFDCHWFHGLFVIIHFFIIITFPAYFHTTLFRFATTIIADVFSL